MHSFRSRGVGFVIGAHLTISIFSLTDIFAFCLPKAMPSSIPTMSMAIVKRVILRMPLLISFLHSP